jgi:hypothetical protein
MQIVAKIYQNRTSGKDQFFQNSSIDQIEKLDNNLGHAHKQLQINTLF